MKATITRPDGTKIEAEGTAAEIVALLAPPVPWMSQPIVPQTCTCRAHNIAAAGTSSIGPVWIGDVPA